MLDQCDHKDLRLVLVITKTNLKYWSEKKNVTSSFITVQIFYLIKLNIQSYEHLTDTNWDEIGWSIVTVMFKYIELRIPHGR